MSSQVYFWQNEEDTRLFLNQLAVLGGTIWTESGTNVPAEMYDDIIEKMSSFGAQYRIIPKATLYSTSYSSSFGSKEILDSLTGIEFSLCCKHNRLSRTYDVGRLYYRNDVNNPYNTQMIVLYKRIKTYIAKCYFYSKNARSYFAPHFKQQYDMNYLVATHLGRTVIF